MNRPDILAIWRATFTRRWHRHADLADIADPIAGHQGRVALLAVVLFPDAHALHRAAIMHDMGEAAVGDVPNPVKEANPTLKAELDRIEAIAMVQMGLPECNLDARELDMLRLCDKLDAVLWARHHRPGLMDEAGWQRDVAVVADLAARLNVSRLAADILPPQRPQNAPPAPVAHAAATHAAPDTEGGSTGRFEGCVHV